jgi:hypothetical protein
LTLTNRGPGSIYIEPSSLVHSFTVHVIAPNYKSTEPDRPVARSGERIAAGASVALPATALRRWGCMIARPGAYSVNMSYGAVDSNTVTFVVR